jgi:hypothetical protein
VGNCDAVVPACPLLSQDIREHIFKPLLRHLQVGPDVVQFSVPQQHVLSGPAQAPLGVEVELVALVRQDQFARRFEAWIAVEISSHPQAPNNPTVHVSIKSLDDFGVTQIDAALQASFRDRRAEADFVAERARWEQNILHLDLGNLGHAHPSRQGKQQDQAVSPGMPTSGRRDAGKVADLPRLERGSLGHVNL